MNPCQENTIHQLARDRALGRVLLWFLLQPRNPIDDPATFDMLDTWIEAVFAFAPVAMLLQPFAQDRNHVPSAGVDLYGERGDGFGTGRKRAEGIAKDVAEALVGPYATGRRGKRRWMWK